MKTIVVLSLLLAVTPLATAGLDLSTIPGLSYGIYGNTLTISSSLAVTGYLFALQPVGGTLSNAVVPGRFETVNTPGFWDGDKWDGVGASVGTAVAFTGPIFSIDFTPGTMSIDFVYSSEAFDESNITIGGQTYYLSGFSVVPEPATMTLLGIGGLLLACRRKELHI